MDCQLIMSLFGCAFGRGVTYPTDTRTDVYYTTFIASLHIKMPLPQLMATVERLDVDERRLLLEYLTSLVVA
jgi:hypothetical protein